MYMYIGYICILVIIKTDLIYYIIMHELNISMYYALFGRKYMFQRRSVMIKLYINN